MPKFVTRIRTSDGDLPVDYNALANLPESDATLSNSGSFADAKATGDAIGEVKGGLSAANSKLTETKTMAQNNAISIEALQALTSLLKASSDVSLDISSKSGAYRITVDDDGISLWYYSTKVGYIKEDTFYSLNSKVDNSFMIADLVATVEDDYVVWS